MKTDLKLLNSLVASKIATLTEVLRIKAHRNKSTGKTDVIEGEDLVSIKADLKKIQNAILLMMDAEEAKEKGAAEYQNHGDFRNFYDSTQKRHYWLLGYYGGGAVAIENAYYLAKEYARENNVPIETVKMDEIFSSRRYKGFKFMYSTVEQENTQNATEMEDVNNYLRD